MGYPIKKIQNERQSLHGEVKTVILSPQELAKYNLKPPTAKEQQEGKLVKFLHKQMPEKRKESKRDYLQYIGKEVVITIYNKIFSGVVIAFIPSNTNLLNYIKDVKLHFGVKQTVIHHRYAVRLDNGEVRVLQMSKIIGQLETGILEIDKQKAMDIITNYAPRGKFYTINQSDVYGHIYVGIDNSSGDAWTEDFITKEECLEWLEGEKE